MSLGVIAPGSPDCGDDRNRSVRVDVQLPRVRRRRLLPFAGLALIALVTSAVSAAAATAAAPTFTAVGGAEQVYATGLAPNAQMSLFTPTGNRLSTQNADSLGGLLFRNVPPGEGYQVQLDPNGPKSGPLTVHSGAAASWDPGIYNQSIPNSGYGYLTTRYRTKLALDAHPPTRPAGQPGVPSSIRL